MIGFATEIERQKYNKTLAVSKIAVTYKQTTEIVFDVWSMIGDQWQIVSLAIIPRLIKEFFDIEVLI